MGDFRRGGGGGGGTPDTEPLQAGPWPLPQQAGPWPLPLQAGPLHPGSWACIFVFASWSLAFAFASWSLAFVLASWTPASWILSLHLRLCKHHSWSLPLQFVAFQFRHPSGMGPSASGFKYLPRPFSLHATFQDCSVNCSQNHFGCN